MTEQEYFQQRQALIEKKNKINAAVRQVNDQLKLYMPYSELTKVKAMRLALVKAVSDVDGELTKLKSEFTPSNNHKDIPLSFIKEIADIRDFYEGFGKDPTRQRTMRKMAEEFSTKLSHFIRKQLNPQQND